MKCSRPPTICAGNAPVIRKGIVGALALLTLLALLAGPAAWGAEPGTAVVILPESASVQSSELLLGNR